MQATKETRFESSVNGLKSVERKQNTIVILGFN